MSDAMLTAQKSIVAGLGLVTAVSLANWAMPGAVFAEKQRNDDLKLGLLVGALGTGLLFAMWKGR